MEFQDSDPLELAENQLHIAKMMFGPPKQYNGVDVVDVSRPGSDFFRNAAVLLLE